MTMQAIVLKYKVKDTRGPMKGEEREYYCHAGCMTELIEECDGARTANPIGMAEENQRCEYCRGCRGARQ